MKRFMLRAAIAATVFACSTLSLAQDSVALDYSYSGDTGVNLGSITGGPLSVSTFTDGRAEAGASDIQRAGKEPLTLQEQTVAALLQSTFEQAFTASGAKLGEAGSRLALEGNVVEMQISETAQGLETLIRVELTLKNGSRNAWKSAVFSRVESEGTDAAAALALGLDRLVAELFRDDYFLIELGIF